MRKIEFFNFENNEWQPREMKNLEIGNIFKIFDDKERYVNKATGDTIWIAKSDPYLKNDIWCVKTYF